MFHYKKSILVIGVLLTQMVLVHVARAQQTMPTPAPSPTPPPPPVIQQVAGQPMTITWRDGREATLNVSATISEHAPLSMTISENSCEPAQRVQCEYRSGLSVATYRLVWSQHTDATKIGKTVRMGSSATTSRQDVSAQITWTQVDNLLYPGLHTPALADELSCPSWDWLTPALGTAITIPSISTEFMLPNPNTQQVENKTIVTATDVVWEHPQPDVLRVQSIGRFDAYLSLGVNALFIGDVMKWNIEKSTNLYCDIGFKVDIGRLQLVYQAILDRSMKDSFSPFIFNGLKPYDSSAVARVFDLGSGLHSADMVYE